MPKRFKKVVSTFTLKVIANSFSMQYLIGIWQGQAILGQMSIVWNWQYPQPSLEVKLHNEHLIVNLYSPANKGLTQDASRGHYKEKRGRMSTLTEREVGNQQAVVHHVCQQMLIFQNGSRKAPIFLLFLFTAAAPVNRGPPSHSSRRDKSVDMFTAQALALLQRRVRRGSSESLFPQRSRSIVQASPTIWDKNHICQSI